MRQWICMLVVLIAATPHLIACSGDDDSADSGASVYEFANGCFTMRTEESDTRFLTRSPGGFAFTATSTAGATPFFLKPSGLASYLLFDADRGYAISDGVGLLRATDLDSDIELLDDSFESEAEWELQPSSAGADRFQLRHRKTGVFVGGNGVVNGSAAAAPLVLDAAAGCATFPEEGVHSEGAVARTSFEDGSVFGIVDTHSHIFANFGYGGGGIFHGAPYHPLGVEHALPSCEAFHGVDGRADFFGAGFDAGRNIQLSDFIAAIADGLLPEFNHATDGYPVFTKWPSGFDSATHQTQYYKWLERAYRGGLRLVVQHAVNNQIICDFLGRGGIQPIRYSCNDMVGVDRQIDEAYRLQDYVDAQEGGPGMGWFRIVTSPEQAREVILAGKMAVVLGVETSNLFDCFLNPPIGFAPCTEDDVVERLNELHERGVRVLFPVHKYDNAFSAGDGDKAFIEIGNLLQTSHFNNFTTECDESVPTVFDRRPLAFPGLNMPRDNFFAMPPNDFSEFFVDPLGELAPFLDLFLVPPLPGVENHCQNAGLTDLGEFLVEEIMGKGMVLEIDHFPRRSYKRVFEMLEAKDYPAAGTHGLDNNGKLYALGGVSKSDFGRCRAADASATVDNGYQTKLQRIVDNGGFPALGFGFDLNGFAGAAGPRFGEKSVCGSTPQSDPLTYPFTSYAGDVTFTQPSVGERVIDFNTEGLVHIGMLPELIEEIRGDGIDDASLEPLFKSAEGYIRMWEKAERRGAAIREERETPE